MPSVALLGLKYQRIPSFRTCQSTWLLRAGSLRALSLPTPAHGRSRVARATPTPLNFLLASTHASARAFLFVGAVGISRVLKMNRLLEFVERVFFVGLGFLLGAFVLDPIIRGLF